jgi:hypothetical protein
VRWARTHLSGPSSALFVPRDRSMTMVTRARHARHVLQGMCGRLDPALPSAHAHSASQDKPTRIAIVRPSVRVVQSAPTQLLDQQSALHAAPPASSMTIAIQQRRARTRTSAFRLVHLAFRMTTVMMRHHARRVARASTRPVVREPAPYVLDAHLEPPMTTLTRRHLVSRAWLALLQRRVTPGRARRVWQDSTLPQLPLSVRTAPRGPRTTIVSRVHHASAVWLALTPRPGTQVLAMRVQRVVSVPRMAAVASQYARCVELGSLPLKAQTLVRFALPAQQTRTAMHRLPAPSVLLGHTPDVVRRSATNARRVKLTATSTLRHRARCARPVRIGKPAAH